jgi:hypothetical protein
MVAYRCLSRDTENQPSIGCQWDCLAVTYCPKEESRWVMVVTTGNSWEEARLGASETRWTRVSVRQRA